jgi:hypothetical protein
MSQSDEENKTLPTGFAPNDLTDGRKPGHWQARYSEPEAKKAILWERNYLLIVFCCSVIIPVVVYILLNNYSSQLGFDCTNLKKYFFGWAGGTLGGAMFSTKWLYHSVAKYNWNIERKHWRILTPHLSAALALVFIVLMNSEMLNIANPKSLTIHKCFGIGFLVGYFSDNAIGKLTELAQVVFGSGLSNKK